MDELCLFIMILQGFKYFYFILVDFKKVSVMNFVYVELIEDEGELRYKIIDIIGKFLQMYLVVFYMKYGY